MKYNQYQIFNNVATYRIVVVILCVLFCAIYVFKAIHTSSYEKYRLCENRDDRYESDDAWVILTTREYLLLKYKGWCFPTIHFAGLLIILLLFLLSINNEYTLQDTKYTLLCLFVMEILLMIFI